MSVKGKFYSIKFSLVLNIQLHKHLQSEFLKIKLRQISGINKIQPQLKLDIFEIQHLFNIKIRQPRNDLPYSTYFLLINFN